MTPQEWFTAAELATFRLPGLPSHRVSIARRAERESWLCRERQASGGGREFHVGSLPPEARAAVLLRQKRTAAPVVVAPEAGAESAGGQLGGAWEGWERKPKGHREAAQRRFQAVLAVHKLIADGVRKLEAYGAVARETGESDSTIRNWCRLVKDVHQGDWLPRLAPRWTGRTVFTEYNPEIYDRLRALFLVSTQPTFTSCYDRVRRWARAEGHTMPSIDTLRRDFARREDKAVVVLLREGERRLEELFPSIRRDESVFYALEAVNCDGHKLDVMATWQDGEVSRPVLIAFQDLYSRKYVGYRLAKAETAHDMGLAFLDVCDRWGVPAHVYVDNTLAMAAKSNTAGAKGRRRFKDREGDALGVLPLVGTEVHFVRPGHGQSKPIERSFGDLANYISKHPACAGAYTGNNPTNKPHDYGTRTIPIGELAKIVAEEIAEHNAREGRRTKVCAGRLSFDAAFEASYRENAGRIRRLAPAQRRLLYLSADRVKVRQRGHIELFKGNQYWSELLTPFIGKEVIVRYHPTEQDLHDTVHAYHINGDYIGEIPCVMNAGFNSGEAAAEHARALGQYKRDKKRQAKSQQRLTAAEALKGAKPIVPPAEPVPGPRDVVAADFTVPATMDRIRTIPAPAKPAGAQERVAASLAKSAGVLDRMLQRRVS